jgi:hypothetical protein
VWRLYADFTTTGPDGRQVAATLGGYLAVPGDYAPAPLPPPARETAVGEFTVTYEGSLQVGATTPLPLRVARAGQPVTHLDRYLGAHGHLVMLRAADLAYLHVHPEEQLAEAAVKFWVAAPSPGRYRAYFDFSVDGVVRTAEFTVDVR